MKSLSRAVAVLALLVATLLPARAWADYTDSSGNIVRWAGGDNVVVTDSNGNTVYSGSATRNSDGSRLLWDGTSNSGSTSGQQVASGVSESSLSGTPSGAIDYSGNYVASTSTGSGTQNGSSSSSPYAGTVYANMQQISVTVGGVTLTGYAGVFVEPSDPLGKGYSVISADSAIGSQLAQNGFQVKDGLVLVTPGASGASMSWTANQTQGSSFTNLSTTQYDWVGGGSIAIDIPRSSGSSGYTPSYSTTYSPAGFDIRGLVAYPEWPATPVGKAVPLVAEVKGNAKQVQAFTAWGGSVALEKQSDGKFRGLLQVPINVRPGVYPLTFEAIIGQSGFPEWPFTVTSLLTVRGAGDTPAGGGSTPTDEPDWWTPPWQQGR